MHTGKKVQMLFIYSLAQFLSGITKAKDWGSDKEKVILFKTSVLQFLSQYVHMPKVKMFNIYHIGKG